MPVSPATAGSLALLDRAVAYTRGCLRAVPGVPLEAPTPCARWNLGQLLAHLDDSLAALTEAAGGSVDPQPLRQHAQDAPRLVAGLRQRASDLLGAWTARPAAGDVDLGLLSLDSDVLAAAGALEVAVHGWDVGRACGTDHPVPEDLARGLYHVALMLVGPHDRPEPFGLALAPAGTGMADLLLAHLGRSASQR
jgi:uncharacterized protein (TIGR03086 family)